MASRVKPTNDENMNEPILERGMIKLVGVMEIFSKIGDFPVPEPEIFAIFIIFRGFYQILGVWAQAISPHLKIFPFHLLD